VAHKAGFDVALLNAELKRAAKGCCWRGARIPAAITLSTTWRGVALIVVVAATMALGPFRRDLRRPFHRYDRRRPHRRRGVGARQPSTMIVAAVVNLRNERTSFSR
jgi:hypothetical protein